MGAAIGRIGQFYFDCLKAEIEAADGLLDGMVIWGDVAYKKSLFFAPDYWRTYFRPWVEAMVRECHAHHLPVIYHGCGNVSLIFEDFIDMGVDAYNPLEAKAGMDCVALRQEYGHRFGVCGNSNIQVWESGERGRIRQEVLRKLNAAKGGGMIFQSDHSVSSSVSGQVYDEIVKLVRQYGTYPLELGEYDIDMVQG
jgi:uroporphyrinogen-III decarboxylase